jgi:hypothetical protein
LLVGLARSVNSSTSSAPASSADRLTAAVTAPPYPRPRRSGGVYTGPTRTCPAERLVVPASDTGWPPSSHSVSPP